MACSPIQERLDKAKARYRSLTEEILTSTALSAAFTALHATSESDFVVGVSAQATGSRRAVAVSEIERAAMTQRQDGM
eukprot:scaffold243264_cov45-Prasinocladus_malaysianus.AAC.2